MRSRPLGAAAAALLLTACAHAYPDLATFHPTVSDQLGDALDQAALLQAEYSLGYKETARWQDLGQLPVIGGAAAAAWVLLKDHAGATTKAGKIAIGTTAYSAARGQLMAAGMPDAYLAGYGALTCVLSEGPTFHGTDAETTHDNLAIEINAMEDQLARVSVLRYLDPDPKKLKGHEEALKTAHTVADQAIAGARTAEGTSLRQLGAWNAAPATFRNAVSSVSVAVASKGRVRPPVDFGTLKEAMLPKTDASGGGNRDPAAIEAGFRQQGDLTDPQVLIQALMAETSKLATRTAHLTGLTPDYLASIERVKHCPDTIH